MQTKIFTKKEDVSYAQQKLLDLTAKRKLKRFWRENLEGKGFNFFYLWNVTVGKVPPSIEFIWKLRKKINPVLWFYTINEEEPQKANVSKSPEEYGYFKSKNYCYIAGLNYMWLWVKENGLSYNLMWHLKMKKRKITYQKIKMLKNILPVKDWFQF